MTESDVKIELRDKLRAAGCFVIRFEDRFTVGIPDMFATRNRHDLWCEVKIDDRLMEPWRWKNLSLQQVVFAQQLASQTQAAVRFLCYSPKLREAVILTPSTLLHYIQTELPIAQGFCFKGKGLDQLLTLL